MNLVRTTTIVLSAGEVVKALKAQHPKDVLILSLPSNGAGVYMKLEHGGRALELIFEKRADLTPGMLLAEVID